MLGLVSRQFEAARSGAGATKGDNRRSRPAEKEKEEKEKERVPAKDGASSLKREGGGRRTERCTGIGRAYCSSAS